MFDWSMIFSENRLPLFGIMLQQPLGKTGRPLSFGRRYFPWDG
jgi:hypothetical protein